MVKTNAFLTILGLGVAACACAGGGQSEADKARQLILKTLERTYAQNVIAIISQRDPENRNSFQSIHVQISKDGKVRQTVIYPLSLQGVETIDDGKLSATFLPDKKLMLIQESPKLLPIETSRINLAVKNYGLTLGGTTTVAGQSATIVVAKPRSRDLETRRYYIDARTGFILQLETIDISGAVRLAFKAQQVTYPARISSSAFDIDQDDHDGRKVIFHRAVSVFNADKGAAALGFTYVLPQSLPFGFDLQDAQINDSGDYRSVAVRISDGLVKGTVYQYSVSTAPRMKAMGGTSTGDGSGIRFVVAADVPEAVRKKILEAFIEAAKKGEEERAMTGLLGGPELAGCKPALTRSDVVLWEMILAVQATWAPLEI